MLLTPQEMRETEEAAFAAGADAESLMDRAGLGIADAISQFFPSPGRVVAFAATGHNGGDAFVAARHLATRGWEVIVRLITELDDLRPLAQKKLKALPAECWRVGGSLPPRTPNRPTIILDGLLGIGARGSLRGKYRDACCEINKLRGSLHAATFAVDIPTGVDGNTGEPDPAAVIADYTLTIGQAKTGLLADSATNNVGRIVVIPLGELDHPANGDPSASVLTARSLAPVLPRRRFDTHKGQAGRVGIIAGSPGMIGAAALCSAAALRAGAGLTFLFVKDEAYNAAAAQAAPEVMVRNVDRYHAVLDQPLDVLGIGPGLGVEFADEVLHVISTFPGSVIIDADGLNILAADQNLSVLRSRAAPTLLTPHPGEMSRLIGDHNVGDRCQTARAFSDAHPDCTLLLKGSRTVIATKNQPTLFNSTGHPGMASGGMGDVLTGIACALGVGCDSSALLHDRAGLAAWLAGRAAERAIADGHESLESTVASDVIHYLGAAFDDIRNGAF